MARKKNTYFKENEFEKWLKNDTTRWSDPTSVSSYKSGVSSMINWVNNIGLWETTGGTKFLGFSYYLQNINSNEDRETFFSAVLNIIQKEIDNNPSNKSTLQNYKSFLSAYEEFFRNEPFPNNSLSQSQRKMLRHNSSCATYTGDELIKEFTGRILTQDRISQSKKVMFPIRLIKKLWNQKLIEETNTWAKGVCNNIWIIVQQTDKQSNKTITKEIQIKDIDTLRIEKTGDVNIVDNKGIEYVMCTSYSDPYEYLKTDCNQIQYFRKRTPILLLSCNTPQNGYIIDKNMNIIDVSNKQIILWHVKPVKAKSIEDIAIDHDIPISLLLIEKEKQLKNLQELSNVYRTLSSQFGLKVTAKEANKFCSMVKPNSNEEKELKKRCNNIFPKKDMDLIGKCKLVLMGKNENSQKSDN